MTLPDDFDPFAATPEGMFDLYREAHAQGCPVLHSTAHGGYDMVMSHAAIRKAAGDWKTFSSAQGVTLPRFPFRLAAMEYDPPDHAYWRGVFGETLNPQSVSLVEESVRQDVARIIDLFASRGSADLVSELSRVVPGNTICRMLGITEPERVRLGCTLGVGLAEAVFDPAQGQVAFEAFAQFVGEEIESRRAVPRDDFLSRVANEEINGHRLSDEEIHGLLTGYFVAGHETTTASMSVLFHTLATDAEVRDRLVADPTLIPRAAEEAMRLESPLHGFFRTTTADTQLGDTPIDSGSAVWLNYAAGNRDPLVFEDPEEFRLDRRPNPHIAFGFGVHACSGAPLARMELKVTVEELLRRLPDITSTGAPVERRRGGFNIVSITSVPVTFTPTSAPPARSTEAALVSS